MRRLIPFLVVIVVSLWMTSAAKAHASLMRSIPDAGAMLAVPPPEVVLEYTEELDPVATKVDLFDLNGQVVIPGPGVIDPSARHILRLKIDTLPDGVYSAVWRARSAVDGHVTNGSVGFSVGEGSPLASLLPPPGTPDLATRLPSRAETFVRWLAYLSVTVAVGSLAFGFFIWRPAYRLDLNKTQAVDETIRRRIRWLALGGLASLGMATILFVMVQAAQARELTLWSALSLPPSELLSGRIGLFMILRLLLIIALGAFVLQLPSPGMGYASTWWIIILLGSAIVLTFSLQGHGAAQGSVLAVVVIWLHLAATAVWLGGLPMLSLALRQEGVSAAVLVPRFSQAALISVATLVVTGIYNGITFVGTTEALTGTTYGRSLITKTGIFALLLTLGAANLFYLSPRLRQAIHTGLKGLTYTVRLEMALGIILLLAVGVLSGVFPAFDALQAQREQGFSERANVDGVDMLVRVAPGQAGDNEIGVEFTDTRPGAEMVSPEVLLRLTALSMDMGTQQVRATSADGLRYSARGSYFPMTGPWELEVIIRRTGFNDVRRIFELEIRDE